MKLIIRVVVPAVNRSYDIKVQDYINGEILMNRISDSISEVTSGKYVSSGEEFLTILPDGIIVKPDDRLIDLAMTSGTEIMFL